MISNYEINQSTLAIIPLGYKKSKIIEENSVFEIEKTPTEIVNHSCKYFGSSFRGRFEGTKNLIGVNYKAPIIVEETREIIFFPTSSPRFENCSWISLSNILKYTKNDYNPEIIFKNGTRISVDISYNTLDNQILRATRLESVLRYRKNI